MDFGAIIKAGTGALGGVLSAALLPIAGPLAPVIGGAVGAIGGAIGDSVTAGAKNEQTAGKTLAKAAPGISQVSINAGTKPTLSNALAKKDPKAAESNAAMYVLGGLGVLALLRRK